MKQSDKFLIIIVVAILGLVIAAFVLVSVTPEPAYRAGETADAVVFNYLLALQKEDYEKALEYISEEVSNRPRDGADMEWDIQQNLWRFDQYDQPAITIVRSRISGDSATVTVKKTWDAGPLLGNASTSEFTMRLQQEESGWKLVDGQTHWVDDWEWDDE